MQDEFIMNSGAGTPFGDLRIVQISTAAVRCAPPGNRPTTAERATCIPFLQEELRLLPMARVLLCLGQIAFEQTARVLQTPGKFAHGAVYRCGGRVLLCSYHVSRQNTQTGRLTPRMFAAILRTAKRLAEQNIGPS